MPTANTSTDSKTVFLVDDDSSTANLYSNGLEQAGFRTASAFVAEEAFEALPNLSADLIILDLMLPRFGGFQLLEAIRSDSRHKDTPVLVLSNAYLPEMAQKALRAGGNKALLKSECTLSELICVSRELVGIAEADGAGQPAAVGVSGTGDSPGRRPIEEPAAADLAEQLKQALMEQGSTEVAAIRQHCLRYVEVVGSEEGKEHLDKVYQSVRFLGTRAGLAGCGRIAQLTGAIEAMLFDQVFRSNSGTSPSSIRTLVQAVDCLDHLFTSGNTGPAESPGKARALLVDDDAVSNMANEVALNRASYDTVSATDETTALILLNDNPFDLVLLEINMPNVNGVEFCQKLRCIPHHKNTPVIFVTPNGDFQNPAQSLLSGGDDFISKPVSPLELIVKATVSLLSTSKPQVPDEQPRIKSPTSPPGLVAASLPAAQSGTTDLGGLNPHPDQTWMTSDSPSANNQADGVSQSQSLMAEQAKLEGRSKRLHTVQATVNEKLKVLKGSVGGGNETARSGRTAGRRERKTAE